MNLIEYQKKRKKEFLNREKEFQNFRSNCFNCMRPVLTCFCHELKAFNTYFRFCFLMHPKEAKKERIGTGRLSHIILENSEIIIDEKFNENKRVQNILQSSEYIPFLLYPGSKSVNISQYQFPVLEFGSKTPVIFILDATWPCAKSMMRESSCLHSLPRISFDPKVKSRFSIKHQPADYCLSTIESVYEVLCLLENQSLEQIGEQKNTLITALKKLVDYQIMCAKDPSRSNYRRQNKTFSIQSQRVQSKKWKKRKICFEGKPKQSLP